MGRPTVYTEELAATICERLASGRSLRDVCRDEGIPDRATIHRWLISNDGFCDQYTRATNIRADEMFDEMFEIADTPMLGEKRKISADGAVEVSEADMIEHRKLQIETRKWSLARMAPKKYGDRTQIQHSGDADNPVVTEDVTDKKLAQAIAHVLSKGLNDDKPE